MLAKNYLSELSISINEKGANLKGFQHKRFWLAMLLSTCVGLLVGVEKREKVMPHISKVLKH